MRIGAATAPALYQAPKHKTRCHGYWPSKTTLPRPEVLYLPALDVATQKFEEVNASKEGL